ncbi:hypothetical protein [Nonomuraea typhae]|uniref:Uncharacterized protein n=1 Tax=Nonomuraea typhae TaxID=2603600 RepID=A0ABW7YJX7_9ACTN
MPADPEAAAREVALKFADHPGLSRVRYGGETLLEKSQESANDMRSHQVPGKRGQQPITEAELSRRGKTAKAINQITDPAKRSQAFREAVGGIVSAHPDVLHAESHGKTLKDNRPKL